MRKTISQKDIVSLLLKGQSTAEVAKTLKVARSTVQNHIPDVFRVEYRQRKRAELEKQLEQLILAEQSAVALKLGVDEKLIRKLKRTKAGPGRPKGKQVEYTVNGKTVVYPSIAEFAKATGVSAGTAYTVLSGKKKSRKFVSNTSNVD